MTPEEDIPAWVALTHTPALHASVVCAALKVVGSVRSLADGTDACLRHAGLPPPAREYLSTCSRSPTSEERTWLGKRGHHLVPFTDPRYPALLRATHGFPIALYVDGRPEVLNDPQLSVVGSRSPSAQGRETAFDLSELLAARGLSITSGLAEGIDSAAHRGALRAHGVTVAVFGSGADVVYPHGNTALSEDIKQQGALVSEFPLGTAPRREHFPQRNRIIAGISLGTLVVEAALRSGSLITARLAGEYGRDLFAIPGSIHNPLAKGCHELIRQGAKLTETADDILRELDFSGFFARTAAPVWQAAVAGGMDKEHKILLDALGFDPADLDMLVIRTGLKPEAVSSMMLILELEGHVQAAPGGRYSRVVRSRR